MTPLGEMAIVIGSLIVAALVLYVAPAALALWLAGAWA